MTILYKLTTQDFRTRKGFENDTLWGPGVTHSGTGQGPLCSPGWIHAYLTPELAILLNPIHAAIVNPILWEAEGTVAISDGQLKVGCKTLTTLRVVTAPEFNSQQRVKFAILSSLSVFHDTHFKNWAEGWLSGENRSAEAAAEAVRAVRAVRAAEWAAVGAAEAARSAAAEAAAEAARSAAEAARSAWSAVWAEWAAVWAEWAARSAAEAARSKIVGLDLIKIVKSL